MSKLVNVGNAAKGIAATMGRWMNEVPPIARLLGLFFRIGRIVCEHGEKFAGSLSSFCEEEAVKTPKAADTANPTPEA